jgi:hypothetical protein
MSKKRRNTPIGSVYVLRRASDRALKLGTAGGSPITRYNAARRKHGPIRVLFCQEFQYYHAVDTGTKNLLLHWRIGYSDWFKVSVSLKRMLLAIEDAAASAVRNRGRVAVARKRQ